MIFVIFIFVLVLLSIQTTFLDLFSLWGITPDLALILVVYCGINFKKNVGTKIGILVGFFQDCLSGGLLGINTLSKGITGLCFSTLKDKIIVEGFLPVSYFLFVASLIDVIVYFFTTISLMGVQIKVESLFYQVAFFGIYNAVTGLFLFNMFDRIRKRVHHRSFNQIFRPI